MNCPKCGRSMTFVKAVPATWGACGGDPPEGAYHICGCGHTHDEDAQAIEDEELGEYLFLQQRDFDMEEELANAGRDEV